MIRLIYKKSATFGFTVRVVEFLGLWFPLSNLWAISQIPSGKLLQCRHLLREVTDILPSVLGQKGRNTSLEAWGSESLSDPKNFDNDNFKFLIRATKFDQKLDNRDDLNLGQAIPAIFSSLVSQDKMKSFGDANGVILKFRPSHVVGTSPEDTRSVFGIAMSPVIEDIYESQFRGYRISHPVLDVDTLLNSTGRTWHEDVLPPPGGRFDIRSPNNRWNNEVVLRGLDAFGQPVEIQAIYIFTDSHGKLIGRPSENDFMLFRLAKKFKLPIVRFRAAAERFENAPLRPLRNSEAGQLLGFSIQRAMKRIEIVFSDLKNFAIQKTIKGTRIVRQKLSPEDLDEYLEDFVSLLRIDLTLINEIEGMKQNLIRDPECDKLCLDFFGTFLLNIKRSLSLGDRDRGKEIQLPPS